MDASRYANRSQKFVRREISTVKEGAHNCARNITPSKSGVQDALLVCRAFWQELDTYSGEDLLDVWIRFEL